MRKMNFKWTLVMLILIVVLSSQAFGAEDQNVMLKVGLSYNNVELNSAVINSESGFSVNVLGDANVIHLFQVPVKTLTAKKDVAFHIQVNGEFATVDEAWQMKEKLTSIGQDAFYGYENLKYKVYVGNFASAAEGENLRGAVDGATGMSSTVVSPTSNYVRVFMGDKTLIMYNSKTTQMFFAAGAKDSGVPVVEYNKKNYRNGIGFRRTARSDLAVINYVNMNEYLYGVLPKEMSGTWPLEALKAQAVAARNYAYVNRGKHGEHGFDICTTVDCQVFGGFEVEATLSNAAVDQTNGKYLLYEGKPVVCYFHSNSGGATESVEFVWSRGVPYLKSVSDPFSLEAPRTFWEKTYTMKEVENKLSAKGFDVGEVKRVYVKEYSSSGRALELVVEGVKDQVSLFKDRIRNVFGYFDLKSTLFTLSGDNQVVIRADQYFHGKGLENTTILSATGKKTLTSGAVSIYNGFDKYEKDVTMEKVVINGQGFGHGVGMSQWGAKKMAEEGYTYDQILTHYYINTYLE